jgi:dipeptidyl aminopeptidase/acylaminoacyl peptidase
MKRALLFVALAACDRGSSSTPTSTPMRPIEPAKPEPVERPAPPPVEVNATPDVPSGAAAKRDAELVQKATGYIDAFVNSEPVPTRDGKQVVFVSNRDGLPQIYIADAAKPDAPARRLITTKERMTSILPTKDGKSLVFLSDTGADELWSIYKVGLDGKDLVELTPGEKLQRDEPIIPDGQPGTMYFSAQKMSESKSTLYSASATTPGPAKPVYTSEKPSTLEDVDDQGKRALVREFPSQSEMYVDMVDLATGKQTRMFPTSGKVSIFSTRFSPDGKTIYVATDGGEEQALVLALDAKTGKEIARHAIAPATARILAISVAKKGGTIAVPMIVGNRSEIRLLDAKKLAPKTTVKMPLGQGTSMAFTEDGKRLTAMWSTPSMPGELYMIDAATGAPAPLRKEPRPSLAGMPKIAVSSVDIPAFDGGNIPANVYVADGEETKPHPTLVIYHGGPAGVSTIRWSAMNAYFIALGYAIVEPNVRGSSGYGRAFEAADNGPKRLDSFKDIETSARWVAKQPFADKDRLVVFGSSYGGYTTLVALSRWPEIWRAGVDLVGIANLKTFMATTSGTIRELFLLEFGDPDKDADFLASISPLTDVGKIVDPTFVYAGANDPRVPRTESDLIVKALRQRKIANEYMVAENEGHSLARRESQLAFYSRCARFLETALR